MNSRNQERKYREQEMHGPSLFVVEEQPERHEPNENQRGALLSEDMD